MPKLGSEFWKKAFLSVALRAFLPVCILSAAAVPPVSGATIPGVVRQSSLEGRWNVAFDMPQGSFETPIEFLVDARGVVTANVLGPLGNFEIRQTSGTLEGKTLVLRAQTSFGKLEVKAVVSGDRLSGRWSPAGFVAALFFKGEMRGLRDRTYVPGDRSALFDAVMARIERDFYAADLNRVDPQDLRRRYRPRVAAAQSDGAFLVTMREMLREFGASHLDFFAMPGSTAALHSKSAQSPAEASEGITWRKLNSSVGYLRIESFEDGPKVIARLDRAFSELQNLPSLVIDLRDNGGGTLTAAMRLGDHLLPRSRPVGYFAGRDGLKRYGARSIDQLDSTKLPAFSGYGSEEFAREMARAGALMLTTGGRAARPYRGRVVVLIDENCFSACEVLAGVVKEAGVATLVGRRTPGAMLAAVPMELEGRWILLIPVWDFRTSKGGRVEGSGIEPDVLVTRRDSRDADLAAALKHLASAAHGRPAVQVGRKQSVRFR